MRKYETILAGKEERSPGIEQKILREKKKLEQEVDLHYRIDLLRKDPEFSKLLHDLIDENREALDRLA